MSHRLDTYVPGHSWLHHLDPRVKLWGVVVFIIIAFLVAHPLAYLAMLLSLHSLLRSSRVPWRNILQFWRQMAMLLILIFVLQPWFSVSGPVLWAWGPLHLTLGGIWTAVSLALRAVTLAFTLATLLFTTEQSKLVRALVCLGLPYTWGLTISLTLRFVPTIYNLFVTVREAQAARGWEPTGPWWQRLREYVPVLVSVIIGTLRASDQLTLALAARGLGARLPRTTWHDLQMRRADWVGLALLTLCLGLVLVIHFGFNAF